MPNIPKKKEQRKYDAAQMLGGRMGTYGSDHPDQSILDWTNMITHVRRKAKAHDYDTIGLEAVATAEMGDIALKMEFRKPKTLDEIAALMGCKTDMDKLHLEDVLEEMCYLGVCEFDRENPEKVKKYSIKSFVPGIAEMLNEHAEWYEEYPQLAEHFELMTYQPFDGAMMGVGAMGLTQMIPEGGAGVGMHVIPVEKAIESENTSIDIEHISHWLDKYDGKYAVSPCSCRQERHERGVGCADDPNHWCIAVGDMADYMVQSKKPGHYIDRDEVMRILKVAEDNGFVHQTTNIDGSDKIFALCNCDVKICNALRTSMLFNTPNLSASAYTAKVNPQNCVACGRCVEFCPAGAVKLGQKLKCKDGSEMTYEFRDDPADHIWLKDRWSPNYRDDNREETYESGTAPCKSACPAHIAIQGYIRLAAQGKYRDALELIKKENPFPAVCGRICPHNCENECTRGEIDDPVSIDEIKKFIADREISKRDRFVPEKLWHFDKKMAIIGSGPAGLSCAYYLAAMGYDKVTVFEKEPKVGGMMMNGIPNFRLEKDTVQAEIDVLKELGVEFRCGVDVGKDVTIQQLRDEGFEAFYLAIGLQNGGKLGIPGDDAQGIISGVDFEKAISRGDDFKLGKNVVVIGGGNIGADVARTAIRYGAKKVDLYCLESYDEMPMGEEDQELCKTDGITIHDGWGQTEVVTKDGKCKGIKFKKCVSVKNKEGRFDPKFDEKVTEEAKCDTILFCIGQKPDYGKMLEGTKVKFTNRGFVVADPLTYQTDEPDIFVGGDVYTGQKFVIDAIAAGKEGANSMNRFVWPGHSLTIGRYRGGYHAIDKKAIDWDNVSYDNSGRQKPHIDKDKVLTKSDERLTFTEQQLKQETERCLKCGATWVDQNKCYGCGICTTRCKFDAIHLIKKFDTRIHGMRFRNDFVENYRKDRNMKIAVKKFRKEDNSRGDASKR